MATPNRPTINVDDAENIRKFSSQIRRTSGQQAFPSGRGQSNTNGAPPVPSVSATTSSNGIPSNAGQANIDGDRALSLTPASKPSTENGTPELPPHALSDQGPRLTHLPRAVQQIMDESPQLKGIQAPHPTPESFKPSPITGVQHLPEPTNEEAGLIINEVLSSLPNAGKFGLEDSMWAPRQRRPKDPNAPRFSDTDGKLIGLTAKQEKKNDKDEAEARERAKEHNQNFERMSFKIADSPSLGKTYAGNSFTKEKKGNYLSPLQDTSAATHRHRSVGTQTSDKDFAVIPKPTLPEQGAERRGSSEEWVKINQPRDALAKPSDIKAAAFNNFERRSVKEDIGKAIANLEISSPAPKVADVKSDPAVKAVGKAPFSTEGSTGETESIKKGPCPRSILAAGLKFAKSRQYAYGAPKIEAPPAEESKDPPPTPLELPNEPLSFSSKLAIQTPATDTRKDSPHAASGQSLSSLTPSSMEFTLASPASIAAAAISTAPMATQEPAAAQGQLEHKIYLKSWGKPQEREGGGKLFTYCVSLLLTDVASSAAQKRKLILYGNPSWDFAPRPSFITDLVFGGPLEQIRCMEHTAEVTFLNSADAQKFFDATPNGIQIRKDSSGIQYAEVKWVEDVTPMSSLVQQHVDNGVTRCVHAIGVEDLPMEELKALARGKMNRQGLPMRKVESIEKGISARNVGLRLSNLVTRIC